MENTEVSGIGGKLVVVAAGRHHNDDTNNKQGKYHACAREGNMNAATPSPPRARRGLLMVATVASLPPLLLMMALAPPYRPSSLLPSVAFAEAFVVPVAPPVPVPLHHRCPGRAMSLPRPRPPAATGGDHIGRNQACRSSPTPSSRRVMRRWGRGVRPAVFSSSSEDDDEDGDMRILANGINIDINAKSNGEESDYRGGASIGRRDVLFRSSSFAALAAAAVASLATGEDDAALAAGVTDETGLYANRAYDSSYRDLPTAGAAATKTTTATSSDSRGEKGATDEFVVRFSRSDLFDDSSSPNKPRSLGIELGQVTFRTNTRVVVQSVSPGSPADAMGVKKGLVIVAVNGRGSERTDARGVRTMVRDALANLSDGGGGKDASAALEITFRDPGVFRDSLEAGRLSEGESVTTRVAPEGDTTQRNARTGKAKFGEAVTSQADQRVTVTQLKAPVMCNRGADVDDLLEISYVGTVVETGAVFDGSTVTVDGRGIPGRGGDVSLFFVLGKQPFGQFPPGWDVGLYGMCVGERRRLVIPPVLAYGSKGMPKRGIPPDATLQYDVTLVSINGLAMPQ